MAQLRVERGAFDRDFAQVGWFNVGLRKTICRMSAKIPAKDGEEGMTMLSSTDVSPSFI